MVSSSTTVLGISWWRKTILNWKVRGFTWGDLHRKISPPPPTLPPQISWKGSNNQGKYEYYKTDISSVRSSPFALSKGCAFKAKQRNLRTSFLYFVLSQKFCFSFPCTSTLTISISERFSQPRRFLSTFSISRYYWFNPKYPRVRNKGWSHFCNLLTIYPYPLVWYQNFRPSHPHRHAITAQTQTQIWNCSFPFRKPHKSNSIQKGSFT